MRNIEVWLDLKTIVAWLHRKIPPVPVPEASSIVDSILLLTDYFAYCRFVFIHRNWNIEFHELARTVLSNESSSLERLASSLGGELL